MADNEGRGERRDDRREGGRSEGGRGDGGPGGDGRSRFGGGAQGGRGGPGGGRGGRGGGGRPGGRRKVCLFCMDNVSEVDYKDLARLRRFLAERGKIEPRRKYGTCARHQRALTVAIKRARQVALLPYTTSGGRG